MLSTPAGIVAEAIQTRRQLSFSYRDGRSRVIEPYVLGVNRGDKLAVLGWLVGGFSGSKAPTHWRQYLIEEMADINLLDVPFGPFRPGGDQGIHAFSVVLSQIVPPPA